MDKTILEKINKLLAKAESCREIGSLQEAEVFSSKISELLAEYNRRQGLEVQKIN